MGRGTAAGVGVRVLTLIASRIGYALIVIAGSMQAGLGWGAEGPKAGFVPFYVGLVILGSSIINFGGVISLRPDDRLFAEWTRSLHAWVFRRAAR